MILFGDIAGHMTFLTSIQIFHLAYKQLWSIHKKNGHRFVTIHLYIVQIYLKGSIWSIDCCFMVYVLKVKLLLFEKQLLRNITLSGLPG